MPPPRAVHHSPHDKRDLVSVLRTPVTLPRCPTKTTCPGVCDVGSPPAPSIMASAEDGA
eukprot:CAMPEP_0185700808 /NCGR_PEP_ID=MMETSP1164-20130828/7700_1 /TAXON_ID=1104430 /ORGANISM="Chrysoreinhardia sp, Strain CCMP2950" /LENGTH=58 /DNA_ID=CAMNT_0028367759 /DNA_START=73 /DNA_END=245 /DNA_ORIENTATION=-